MANQDDENSSKIFDYAKINWLTLLLEEKMAAPFMRPPDPEYEYEVGDIVEVLCDHDRKGERVRGWLRGIVVQTDPKMVAVQFRANVYLTDGWMVPDHILWFPQTSGQIRKPRKRPVPSNEDLL